MDVRGDEIVVWTRRLTSSEVDVENSRGETQRGSRVVQKKVRRAERQRPWITSTQPRPCCGRTSICLICERIGPGLGTSRQIRVKDDSSVRPTNEKQKRETKKTYRSQQRHGYSLRKLRFHSGDSSRK